jgi:GAF domain-containing protein
MQENIIMSTENPTVRNLREDNIRLRDEVKRLQDENDRLNQIIQSLNTLQYHIDAITPETGVVALIHNILSSALKAVNSSDGSLLLEDTETKKLVFVDSIGKNQKSLIGIRIPSNEGIAGWTFTEKSPVLVDDARKDERWTPNIDEAIGFRTASLIAVPLLDGDRALGVIEALNPHTGQPFSEGDLDIMILVSRLASLALVQAEKTARE